MFGDLILKNMLLFRLNHTAIEVGNVVGTITFCHFTASKGIPEFSIFGNSQKPPIWPSQRSSPSFTLYLQDSFHSQLQPFLSMRQSNFCRIPRIRSILHQTFSAYRPPPCNSGQVQSSCFRSPHLIQNTSLAVHSKFPCDLSPPHRPITSPKSKCSCTTYLLPMNLYMWPLPLAPFT